MKKLDLYLLRNFLGLFLMTFMIACFILLMQFLWMRINDIVGKGVEISVMLEFLLYALASVVPLALPLAVLLSSLMTFGNLGEKFELTAMKAAGISLFRIMRSLIIFIALLSVGAVLFSNYVLPVSQTKLWALVFSMRQKNPELDIPQGEFYDGITGYTLYVGTKHTRTGLMEDLMIYDYSNGFQNASVTIADSGRVLFTDDNKYLLLKLYAGESFENLSQQQQRATGTQKAVPYRRETFGEKVVLINFDTDLARLDESILDDQHVSKNIVGLLQSIDSVNNLSSIRSREQAKDLTTNQYFGRKIISGRDLGEVEDISALKETYSVDTLYAHFTTEEKGKAMDYALNSARALKDRVDYNAIMLDEFQRYVRKHEIELHRKFSLAFACLIFFFIGAPLGAIIRKGGLGAPIVISVILFIIYYIIDNAGYKMAREGLWPVWAGMWLSSFVTLPIGVLFTYKATHDSALFNPEAWLILWRKIQKRKSKKS